MSNPLLLVEPSDLLAHLFGSYLDELGYEFDLVDDPGADDEILTQKPYECVLINIDLNRPEWRSSGFVLAESASKHGIPVVLIADYDTDAARAAALGWTVIRKPFTFAKLDSAIAKSVDSTNRR